MKKRIRKETKKRLVITKRFDVNESKKVFDDIFFLKKIDSVRGDCQSDFEFG